MSPLSTIILSAMGGPDPSPFFFFAGLPSSSLDALFFFPAQESSTAVSGETASVLLPPMTQEFSSPLLGVIVSSRLLVDLSARLGVEDKLLLDEAKVNPPDDASRRISFFFRGCQYWAMVADFFFVVLISYYNAATGEIMHLYLFGIT